MAGTNSSKTGREAGFYASFTGDFAAPIFFEVTIAKDVSMSSSTEKKEDDCRGENGDKDKRYTPGSREKSVSLEICHRTADPVWNGLIDAAEDCTTVDVLKLDCKIDEPGAVGNRFNANIFEFECNQPLDDPQNETLEFSPSACTDDPCQRVTIDPAGDLVDADGQILVDLP